MWKICVMLFIATVLDSVLQSDALIKNRRREKAKRVKSSPGNIANQLASLKNNVSSLWTEIKDRESTRVMVHVHGIGDDPTETHEKDGGTHVHIHMHLDSQHDDDDDHDHADHHDDHDHADHHGGNKTMDHDHEDHHDDHDHDDHHHHGKKKGCSMMKMKKMKMKMKEHMHMPSEDTYVYGHCEVLMNPVLQNSQHNVSGSIHFRQKMNKPLEMLLHLKGFHVPSGTHADHPHAHTHGFHVHQYGDLSNGCQSFGGHFNPDGVEHSAKDSEHRHAGDWGNIVCDDKGEVHTEMTDDHTSLIGSHSIVGRGLVIHEHEDDLGQGGVDASLKTGNAGGRLACCIVAWAKEHDWDKLLEHNH